MKVPFIMRQCGRMHAEAYLIDIHECMHVLWYKAVMACRVGLLENV